MDTKAECTQFTQGWPAKGQQRYLIRQVLINAINPTGRSEWCHSDQEWLGGSSARFTGTGVHSKFIWGTFWGTFKETGKHPSEQLGPSDVKPQVPWVVRKVSQIGAPG